MSRPAIVLGIAGLYLLASLVLGLVPAARSSKSASGYVAGDRGLGLLVMYFITGATIFSAFAFLGLPGWAYSRGAAAFYIMAYGTLGMMPLYFLGPRAARVGRRFDFVTQGEMMAHRFREPLLAGWMALVSVAAFVPYLALQMKGAGFVLETMSEGAIPAAWGALLVYGVVTVYVLGSGVLGVGWTNTFQGAFMMVLAWGLGLYLPAQLHGGVTAMFDQLAQAKPELLTVPGLGADGRPWSAWTYGSSVLVSMVGFSMWPHLFMKSFGAKDVRTLKRTVVLYPTFQIFLLPLLFIGFAGIGLATTPERPDQILPHILMSSDIGAIWVGVFCAGALAASMSSGDAMAHAAASIAIRDGWLTSRGREAPPRLERRLIQASVLVVMVLAYGVAIAYRGSLVTLLLTTYGAVVQFAPGVVCALYVPRARGRAVLTALVLGTGITALLVLWPQLRPIPIHAGAYGLLGQVLILIPWTAASRSDPEDRAFVAAAAGRSASDS